MQEGSEGKTQGGADPTIAGFAAKVSRYFLDFLETDFKKQQAPRRKIQLTNDAGFRTGLPLRKYPTLYTAIWKALSTPVGELQVLRIARNRFTAALNPTLRDLIRQHVDSVEPIAFDTVRGETLEFARRKRGSAIENPEGYVENVQTSFMESVGKHIVNPVLAFLDGPFRHQSYSAVESVYEVETDLVDALAFHALEHLPAALNTFVVSSDLTPTKEVLDRFFVEKEAKERIKSFFEDFATADAFQELRDLMNYMSLGGENLQIYLYACDLRFGTMLFPVFYIPVTVSFDQRAGDLVADFDPRLYINKRAIDYVIQELDSSAVKLALSPVDNRIVYIDPQKSFLDEMERTLVRMSSSFDISGDFDVRAPKIQTLSSARLRLSKAAYFAVFDRSDESLLNDYEALLSLINKDQIGVTDLFQKIIEGFLIDEPISVKERVSDTWDEMSIPDRLVAVSPIPLNEEQRKILNALNDPQCRFITVQGPPGTGKSHTITAIAFDCILNGKNALVLSDKQEALDVVEDKLKSALASVRQDSDFPDPILRLGRTGNTYTRLISQSSQEKIRNHYRAAKTHTEKLKVETDTADKEIRQAIEQTIEAYSAIRLKEVEEFHQLEEQIETRVPGFVKILQQPKKAASLERLEKAVAAAIKSPSAHEFFSDRCKGGSYEVFLSIVQAYAVAGNLVGLRTKKEALSLFDHMECRLQPVLQEYIHEYERLRSPIFGYLFRRQKARAIDTRLGQELPCTNSIDLHRHLGDLRTVHHSLVTIKQTLAGEGLTDELGGGVYWILLNDSESCPDALAIRELLETFKATMNTDPEILSRLTIAANAFESAGDLLDFIIKGSRYMFLWQKVAQTLASAPAFDYVGSKSVLEQLYTTRMTFPGLPGTD